MTYGRYYYDAICVSNAAWKPVLTSHNRIKLQPQPETNQNTRNEALIIHAILQSASFSCLRLIMSFPSTIEHAALLSPLSQKAVQQKAHRSLASKKQGYWCADSQRKLGEKKMYCSELLRLVITLPFIARHIELLQRGYFRRREKIIREEGRDPL